MSQSLPPGSGLLPQGYTSPQHAHIISLQPLQSPQPSPLASNGMQDENGISVETGTEDGLLLLPKDRRARERLRLCDIVWGLYALLLVALGLILPLTRVLASLHTAIFEVFYIYLFGVSIIFLVYVYLCVLRQQTQSRQQQRRNSKPQTNDPLLAPAKPTQLLRQYTGSFYLRIGAVGFGIGAMIHEGLMFGQLFETSLSAECLHITRAIRPIVQLIFTFVQLYFIFLNAKMHIERYVLFSRFGLMHMIATNMCIWLRTVIMETVREVRRHQHGNCSAGGCYDVPSVSDAAQSPSPAPLATVMDNGIHLGPHYSTSSNSSVCPREEIISQVVDAASPYLYPCTIAYSIIASGIVYVMWQHMSIEDDDKNGCVGVINNGPGCRQRARECSGAGLFSGVLVLVVSIISGIVLFVLTDKPGFQSVAALVMHSCALAVQLVSMAAVLLAAYRMRRFVHVCGRRRRHERAGERRLEAGLLLLGAVGVLVQCVAAVFAGIPAHILLTAAALLTLAQSIAQTVFILHTAPRRCPEHGKPGRELVTFLIVTNIAMWGMNTVLRTDPLAAQYYGYVTWSVLDHCCTPLAIFYRFHSTVCLAGIWKNAYSPKLLD